MSIKVEEKFRGRTRSTGPNATAEIIYLIRTTDSETEEQAEVALLEYAPSTYAGLFREGIGLFEEIKTGDEMVRQLWQGTVRYTQPGFERKERRTSFHTTGGTQHIQLSRGNVGAYRRPGEKFIDFKNAIGVQSGSSGVAGVDIVVPAFEWREEHIFTEDKITPEYLSTLYTLTGTINKKPWRVFPEYTLLFQGIEGDQLPDNSYSIMFEFNAAFSEAYDNIAGIKGDNGEKILKRGQDYLWIFYQENDVALEGSAEKLLLPVPHQIMVERVYREADFADLGIGS